MLCGSSLEASLHRRGLCTCACSGRLPHLREQGDTRHLIVAGTGLTVTFTPHGSGDPIAGIERIEEGTFVDGRWQRGRVLNGDQSHQGRHLRLPPGTFGIQRVTLYRYR